MVARRALAERQPNQAHFFNANSLLKKLTPAVPDHAQIAAEAGIADYFDALHARHFKDAVGPAERGHRVHDLMRGQEMALAAPLLDWLRQRNDVRVLRSEEHTSELQSLMRISYAVFCLKKKK